MFRSVFLAALLLGACRPATSAPRANAERFTGYYTAAFERSTFQPCGTSEQWWVEFDTLSNLDSHVFPRLARLDERPDSLLGEAHVFARLKGDTSGTGKFGHLGQYSRRLHVIDVIDLQPWTDIACNGLDR
jgi:hypothetical protein